MSLMLGYSQALPRFPNSFALCIYSCSLVPLLHSGLFRQKKGEGFYAALPGGCPQDRKGVEHDFYLFPNHSL